MIDTTLIILKPDAVKRKLVGEIITRIEKKNLSIARMNMRTLDKEILDQHYEEHKEKGFYPELVDFMSSGPVVVMEVQGRDAQLVMRNLMGSTDPATADPGTIRGDLGIEFTENLIHGSDSQESAAKEINIFFGS
ncbi:MAG TPA: nucleoside-diphosphate kinase [Acidimicrobiia bacterium]|nr:nucleoside-diphosphate kinase [Acidimicrobiia bacterium]